MRATRVRTAVAAAVLGAASLIGIVVAQPAQAATPHCAGNSNVVRNNLVFQLPTTSNGSGNYNCQLVINDGGPGVVALQSGMRDCDGQSSLKADGSFGPLTRQAVRNTQALVNAHVDGQYGPETRSKMNWLAQVGGTARFVCTKFGI